MTDKEQLAKLNKAVASLKRTTEGYKQNPNGVHWRTAMNLINDVREDLVPRPSAVPNLGPIVRDGKSILLHDLTHATDRLPLFPAFDDAFGDSFRDVIAPENCVVIKQSGSQGGDAFYIRGESKIEYWIGHIIRAPLDGTRFKKGERMADVAPIPAYQGGPHVHCGINAKPLVGFTLIHHTNYTHGAPTVGVQLKRALDT